MNKNALKKDYKGVVQRLGVKADVERRLFDPAFYSRLSTGNQVHGFGLISAGAACGALWVAAFSNQLPCYFVEWVVNGDHKFGHHGLSAGIPFGKEISLRNTFTAWLSDIFRSGKQRGVLAANKHLCPVVATYPVLISFKKNLNGKCCRVAGKRSGFSGTLYTPRFS